MWRRILNIVLMILAWGAILAYILYALSLTRQHHDSLHIGEVKIEILDSTATSRLVSGEIVEKQLKKRGFKLVGESVSDVEFLAIKEQIEKNDFIERADIYTTLSGVMHIDITQRKPVMRLLVNGYNSYITSSGYIFRTPKESAYYTPVITGTFRPLTSPQFEGSTEEFYKAELKRLREKRAALLTSKSSPENIAKAQQRLRKREARVTARHDDLTRLTAFVQQIGNDDFWRAEVVQFVADTTSMGRLSLRLIPRSGGHTIEFGELEDIEAKMARLEKFYEEGLTKLGWDRFKTIDIRYDKQVICRE